MFDPGPAPVPGHMCRPREVRVLARFGFLEWAFTVALVALVGAAAVFGAFVVAQLFRAPGGRSRGRP